MKIDDPKKRKVMRTRKNYEPKFRVRVVLETIKGQKTIAEISKEYKVHSSVIMRWKSEVLEKLPSLFQKTNNSELEEAIEKTEELYKEIGKLKMEVDYLKKKLLN